MFRLLFAFSGGIRFEGWFHYPESLIFCLSWLQQRAVIRGIPHQEISWRLFLGFCSHLSCHFNHIFGFCF